MPGGQGVDKSLRKGMKDGVQGHPGLCGLRRGTCGVLRSGHGESPRGKTTGVPSPRLTVSSGEDRHTHTERLGGCCIKYEQGESVTSIPYGALLCPTPHPSPRCTKSVADHGGPQGSLTRILHGDYYPRPDPVFSGEVRPLESNRPRGSV